MKIQGYGFGNATMKEKYQQILFTPSQSTLKYWSENRQRVRRLIPRLKIRSQSKYSGVSTGISSISSFAYN